jgi:hypothetical protein
VNDDLFPLEKKRTELDGPVRMDRFAKDLVNFDDAVAAVKAHWEKRKPEIKQAIQLNQLKRSAKERVGDWFTDRNGEKFYVGTSIRPLLTTVYHRKDLGYK